jgi:anaerobic dimethyl sulfoxide reductase subunit C (anchor subunit)
MLRSREWPLIIFTVFSQMAVGAFLVLVVFRLLAVSHADLEEAIALTIPALVMISATLALGVAAAAFHLSRPSRAVHAMANLGSSGLSREMLMGLAFGAALAVYAGLEWFRGGSPAMRLGVALISAVVGIVFIAIAARAYMLRTVPVWNTVATPVTFFTTALLLGTANIGTMLMVVSAQMAIVVFTTQFVQGLGVASAVFLGVQVAIIPLHIARLSAQGGAAAESSRILADRYRGVYILRLILAAIGVGLFNLAAFWHVAGGATAMLAFVLVLVAEVLGRFLFYATYRRVGL